MDRRGFLKTLLMIPVAALIKPQEVPDLVAGLEAQFKHVTWMPKWVGAWVGHSDLEQQMSEKLGEQMALTLDQAIMKTQDGIWQAIDKELLTMSDTSVAVAQMYERRVLTRMRTGHYPEEKGDEATS